MRMPPPPRHGRWRAKFSTTGKPSPPSSPTPISRRQTTTPRRRCDMPSSLDASASAQEQTKGREPMPPFSASSKHAGDENSTRGRSSPKPPQTPEGASRLQCCLPPCCQPDKGEVNGYSLERVRLDVIVGVSEIIRHVKHKPPVKHKEADK